MKRRSFYEASEEQRKDWSGEVLLFVWGSPSEVSFQLNRDSGDASKSEVGRERGGPMLRHVCHVNGKHVSFAIFSDYPMKESIDIYYPMHCPPPATRKYPAKLTLFCLKLSSFSSVEC